jgi:hypothetical protein
VTGDVLTWQNSETRLNAFFGAKRRNRRACKTWLKLKMFIQKFLNKRIWNKRPDGLAIKMPTSETVGEFVILEFKRMSDVTEVSQRS